MPYEKRGKILRIDLYPDQVAIFHDGGVSLLSRSDFDREPLHVGDNFQESDHVEETSTYQSLLDKCYQWLAIRDYPVHELRVKLKDHESNELIIERVMGYLLMRNLLNDETYANQQFNKVLELGYGSAHLKEVLKSKYIPDPIIESVVERYSHSQEYELAMTLLDEWRNVSTLQQKAPASFAGALMNRLKTRGFRIEILEALQEHIIQLARSNTKYSIEDQLQVYQRLQFSLHKQQQKLLQLGFDDDVIMRHLQEVHHD